MKEGIGRLEITGVLMTGGSSRRMGTNKAFLEYEGKQLIQRSLAVLQATCREVLISSGETELYNGYGCKVVQDVIKGKGPLGGLYSVLREASNEHIFLVACDMPFLQTEAITAVYRELGEYDAVVPYAAGRIHPLHACYHRRILPFVEKNIHQNKLKLTDLLTSCNTKIWDLKEAIINSMERDLMERSLWNINTPDEWENIKKRWESRNISDPNLNN